MEMEGREGDVMCTGDSTGELSEVVEGQRDDRAGKVEEEGLAGGELEEERKGCKCMGNRMTERGSERDNKATERPAAASPSPWWWGAACLSIDSLQAGRSKTHPKPTSPHVAAFSGR